MNDICRLLQIRYPIIQGGMGNISNAKLASAVSEAGGLGTIGVGTMPPDEVEEIIVETKRRTNRPFAVNIPLQVTPYLEEMVSLVLKHRVPVVSLSAGNPAPWIPRFAAQGIKVIVVTASVKQAKKAEAAGADIVVAEGYEAAGINSSLELTTMTLIPQIASTVNIPVVAAGGIGDGRGLLAALALGAQGVQLGTRLIATKDAPFHEAYKQLITNAEDNETVIVGRTVGRVRRIMRTPYAEKLLEYEKQGMPPEQFQEYTSEDRHRRGALHGDFHEGFVNAGQIAGLIDDMPTVAELFEQMMAEAKQQLGKLRVILGE
ncbi:nitronate monooxygenase [Saccharococcus caldoxylosilyticus]|jgi:enoyl-[acyl-carrier protein] reductase II|uniref:Probable nitronate monooxygenase n=1 Tax=Saccharococcus caldoxylosilyticus TaxID=81408 RepID=A0A150LRL2_9BACL|nr:nitronate monooxygenase [Parageobacillus caldoxylosilyticus]KYD14502.1 Enoyl-[acyl-carrier-protein] reductase [Parageobacillus caldoxylosilyticus]OQP03294.1 2-nitropropane dioxygenase [Geobacillus sp. 44B]QNU36787.1 nitronate monooxygenase [Geobacillus sp. 44B]QXJ40002.1 Nitronate monooxygenase [Parageobacillus caldoxylosilyticus]